MDLPPITANQLLDVILLVLQERREEHQRLTDQIVLLQRAADALTRVQAIQEPRTESTNPAIPTGPAVSIRDARTGLQLDLADTTSPMSFEPDLVITFPDGTQATAEVKRTQPVNVGGPAQMRTRKRPIQPDGSTARVVSIVSAHQEPLSAADLVAEFTRHGWIDPAWSSAEGVITQAARRAVNLSLITQTPDKRFTRLPDPTHERLPVIDLRQTGQDRAQVDERIASLEAALGDARARAKEVGSRATKLAGVVSEAPPKNTDLRSHDATVRNGRMDERQHGREE